MKHGFVLLVISVTGTMAGHALAADKPLDQSRIISVRPAIPDGAKAFVARQNQQSKPAKKSLFDGWFQKKQQPAAINALPAPQQPKRPFGQRFKDFFSPKTWGKKKASPPQNQNQQQIPANQFAPGQSPTWTQQGGMNPSTVQAQPGQTVYPPQMQQDPAAPASQPGFGG